VLPTSISTLSRCKRSKQSARDSYQPSAQNIAIERWGSIRDSDIGSPPENPVLLVFWPDLEFAEYCIELIKLLGEFVYPALACLCISK
jgi:hypothetical protein